MDSLKSGRRDGEDSPNNIQSLLNRCSHLSKPGNTMIDDLTDALLLEILVRIHDVKSAHQCKSVSKRWQTLISTPWFFRSFVRHQITVIINNGRPSPPPLRLPFTYIPEYPGPHRKEMFRLNSSPNMFGPPGFSLTFLPCYNKSTLSVSYVVRVAASSNDLLLCSSSFTPAVYYICNPFTKQWVEIPLCSHINVTHKYDYSVIGFVCDPHYKVVFDNKNGFRVVGTLYRYEIVRVSCLISSPKSYSLEIFSFETGKWSELDLHVSCPRLLQVVDTHPCSTGIVCNGRLHWTCGKNYIFAHDPFNNKNNNIIDVIDRPVELWGAENVQIGVCGGRLRLLKLCRDGMVAVWELEDYRSVKWRKVQEDSFGCTNPMWNRTTVSFHPYDGDMVYFWYSSMVVSCDHGWFEEVIRGGEDSIYDVGTKVLSLLQPWFPTPVSQRAMPFRRVKCLYK